MKEIRLEFVLAKDQVGIAFTKKVTEALLRAEVITSEDEVHLLGRTHSYVLHHLKNRNPR